MSSIIIWRKPGMYRKGKWSVNCDVGYFISFEITKYIEYELKIKSLSYNFCVANNHYIVF